MLLFSFFKKFTNIQDESLSIILSFGNFKIRELHKPRVTYLQVITRTLALSEQLEVIQSGKVPKNENIFVYTKHFISLVT